MVQEIYCEMGNCERSQVPLSRGEYRLIDFGSAPRNDRPDGRDGDEGREVVCNKCVIEFDLD